MALFGDFGKVFLGGATAGEVAGGITGALTGSPGAAAAAKRVVGGASEAISGVFDNDTATTPSQAGIDSPATLRPISQTSQFIPGGPSMMDPFSQQAGAALGLGPITTGITVLSRFAKGQPLTTAFGLGGAIGAGLQFFDEFGNPRKLIITRKMQREVKEIFMFTGGNISNTAQIYSNFKMRSYSDANILAIMLKKFTNQGPFVTKAAVRKTRQTIRKMKTLCDMHDDLAPKRRAPARRRASTTKTTLIRN